MRVTCVRCLDIQTTRVTFSNYLGIGVDAAICTEFHEARQAAPGRFAYQLGNKIWYAIFGGKQALAPSCATLVAATTLTSADSDDAGTPPFFRCLCLCLADLAAAHRTFLV